MPVAIVGMHRSGTSMVAGLLHEAGLFLGTVDDVLGAAPENPAGFWENAHFIDLNEKLLNVLGGDWDLPPENPDWSAGDLGALKTEADCLVKEFSEHEHWGWKDPRTSLTLPFWFDVVPDLRVVICVRNLLEVALSLHERNNLSYGNALTLWKVYNERALQATRLENRLVTHFDAYFSDGEAEVKRLLEFCSLSTEVSRDSVRAHLRSWRLSDDDFAKVEASPDVVELYEAMCKEAGWRRRRSLAQGARAKRSDRRSQGAGRLDRRLLDGEFFSRARRNAAGRNEATEPDRCNDEDRPAQRELIAKLESAEQERAALAGALESAEQERAALAGALESAEQERVALAGALEAATRNYGELREELRAALTPAPARAADTPLRILFLLPTDGGLLPTGGGGGGSHSVVLEAHAMRELGVGARVAIEECNRDRYFTAYGSLSGLEHLFTVYETTEEIIGLAGDYDCVVATIFYSMNLAKLIVEAHPGVVAAYYIQDYEPWFFDEGTENRWMAAQSYRLVPSTVAFAKTQWLCELVSRKHGVRVHKVAPSLDQSLFYPAPDRIDDSAPVRISAMIRPSTAYRAAPRTMRVLERVAREFDRDVRIVLFGCDDADIVAHELPRGFLFENKGVLPREQTAELFRQSDVFVDLSEWQAFGRTGMEAMACGCAIVVPEIGGVREFAEHRRNALIVDTHDEEACFAAISEFLLDPALRRRLREAGLRKAREYSLERAARSEIEVLSAAVNARATEDPAERATRRLEMLLREEQLLSERRSYEMRHLHVQTQRDLQRRHEDVQVLYAQTQRELQRRDEEILELQTTIRQTLESLRARESDLGETIGELRAANEYAKLVREVTSAIRAVTPVDAPVAVVSRGDDSLLDLAGRPARHFPAGPDGSYAGHHPEDDAAAIAEIEALRSKGALFLVFPATARWWLDHYAGLARHLDRTGKRVLDDYRCVVFALPKLSRSRRLLESPSPLLSRQERYEELVRQVNELVRTVVTNEATVAVVSKGDDAFLAIGGAHALHFPCDDKGRYAGHYPADSAEAIRNLEDVRAAGVDVLVLPRTAFWWLDHYVEFRSHIETRYQRVWGDERCVIYGLSRRHGLAVGASFRARRLAKRLPPVPSIEPIPGPAVAPPTEARGDDRTFLVEPISPPPPLEPHRALVDIVICVHNALDDVRRCLEAVVAETRQPYRIIVIDDGSDQPTRAYLDEFAAARGCRLIRNAEPRGYTFAANQGLEASSADYILLLNSDTIVTPDWLDRFVQCAESDRSIGVVGPLSNAATWQSVPEVISDGEWARNELPEGITPAEMARMIARYSGRVYPRLPFLNGFCLLVKRQVLDEVGFFDEERFGDGYGEENDFCMRVRNAGWELAVADDAYVFHRLGTSYGDRRKVLSERANETLLAFYGRESVDAGVATCRHDRVIEGVRARAAVMLEREHLLSDAARRWSGKRVAFVLPVWRPGGGANIVMHEAEALWRMGLAVSLINLERNRSGFDGSFPDNRIPVVWVTNEADVSTTVQAFDVVFATWWESVYWIANANGRDTGPARAYYIQDFEPYFYEPGSRGYELAWGSYTLFPDLIRVAKTEWDRDEVRSQTGVESAVGLPTLDIDLQRPRRRRGPDWPQRPLRVLAMIRPSSPRRAPRLTMEVLRELKRKHGDAVEVVLFGCETEDPEFQEFPIDFEWRNAGVINRLQVASVMNEVEVFVDFSKFQAQGLTAMEAMAAGVAVVVPARGGSTTFVVDGVNGFVVDTRRGDECLAATERLVRDHDLRVRVARQALRDICAFHQESGAFRTLEAVLGSSRDHHSPVVAVDDR